MAKRNAGVAIKTLDNVPVTRGSENVYADLGFANPAEELAKAQFALMIDQAIQERGLTQHRRDAHGC